MKTTNKYNRLNNQVLKSRRILPWTFIFFFLFASWSCERIEPADTSTFNCSDCYQDKPEWLPLNIKVSISAENPYVPIKVFIGDREDNVLDWTDTAFQEDYWVDVHPDRYYSVEARYKDGADSIFAIDGDKINAKYSSDDCDQPCYYQVGGFIDVRLLK